jgi:hypothetical protein
MVNLIQPGKTQVSKRYTGWVGKENLLQYFVIPRFTTYIILNLGSKLYIQLLESKVKTNK